MALKIHSGLLRHRVVFKQPVTTTNGQGGKEKTYPEDTIVTRAHVKGVDEYRASAAGATHLIGSVEIYIRYRGSATMIKKDWVMVYDNKLHIIHSIVNVEEDKRFVKITAKSKE